MRIGVPKEVKNHEYRVAITPIGVHELVAHGHEVSVEKDAGVGSQIDDAEYVAAGARIIDSADDVWGEAEMVLKVKEPVAEEYHRMAEGQVLFTYLHLAADRPLTEELAKRQVTGIAYETVQLPVGLAAPALPDVRGRRLPGAAGRRPLPDEGRGRPRRAARRRRRCRQRQGRRDRRGRVRAERRQHRARHGRRRRPCSTPTWTSCGCRSGATTTACTAWRPPSWPSSSRCSRPTW